MLKVDSEVNLAYLNIASIYEYLQGGLVCQKGQDFDWYSDEQVLNIKKRGSLKKAFEEHIIFLVQEKKLDIDLITRIKNSSYLRWFLLEWLHDRYLDNIKSKGNNIEMVLDNDKIIFINAIMDEKNLAGLSQKSDNKNVRLNQRIAKLKDNKFVFDIEFIILKEYLEESRLTIRIIAEDVFVELHQ